MTISFQEVDAMLTAPGQPFEVTEQQLQGVRVRMWKNAPLSLRQVLQDSQQYPDRVGIVYEDERLTYAEHFRRVTSFAHRLIEEYGVQKGDRIAIAMRNYPEWSIAFWATVAIGAVAVPLNAWWTATEIEYGLKDSGSRVLIADQERYDRLAAVLPDLDLAGVIVARASKPNDAAADFMRLVQDGRVGLPDAATAPDDLAMILYTSGTTGQPKGALLKHRHICNQVMSGKYLGVRALLRAGGQLGDLARFGSVQQSTLLPMPLFHVTGCVGVLVNMLAGGGKCVMMYKWNAARALDLIESERITMCACVPTMAWQLAESPDLAKRDLSSLLAISYGGAPATPELMRRLRIAFPAAQYSSGYGLTEAATVVSNNAGADYVARPDSAGVALPICDVKVVDAEGREVARGEPGELWLRGPNVVEGYWNRPEETARSFTDGWFRSGDIGRIDEEGFIYIVDRLKDMIIRGGENVYCSEVEAALVEHPKVKAAAVFGLPHPVLGEEVGAVVQVDPKDPVDPAELESHARQRLAVFKVPSRVWFREEPLPISPAGKVLKRELREQVLR
jgi:long-chain acyl-CoA synthetase